MKATNKFDSHGAYACRCCGRKTRSTGQGDNENCLLCVECFELSGYENMVEDGHVLTDNDRACIAELREAVVKKGGQDKFANLVPAQQTNPSTPTQQEPEMKTTQNTNTAPTTAAVKRPQRGVTKDIWDTLDTAIAEVLPCHIPVLAQQKGWNVRLTRSHFRQWRLSRGGNTNPAAKH